MESNYALLNKTINTREQIFSDSFQRRVDSKRKRNLNDLIFNKPEVMRENMLLREQKEISNYDQSFQDNFCSRAEAASKTKHSKRINYNYINDDLNEDYEIGYMHSSVCPICTCKVRMAGTQIYCESKCFEFNVEGIVLNDQFRLDNIMDSFKQFLDTHKMCRCLPQPVVTGVNELYFVCPNCAPNCI